MEEGWLKKKKIKALSSPVAAVSIFFIPCVTDTHFTPKLKYITTNENYYFPRGTGI